MKNYIVHLIADAPLNQVTMVVRVGGHTRLGTTKHSVLSKPFFEGCLDYVLNLEDLAYPTSKICNCVAFQVKKKKKEGKGGLLQIPLNGEAEGVSHSLKWQHTTQLLIDLVFQHHMTKLP